MISAIVYKDLVFPYNNLSEEVINLMTLMLDKNHESRIRITDVEYHPWVSSEVRTPQQRKNNLLQLPSEGSLRKPRPSASPRRSKSPMPKPLFK